MYHFIVFKDGTKEKCPVEKYTEDEIRLACQKAGKEIESIRQGVLEEKPKEKKKFYYLVRMDFTDDTYNTDLDEDEIPTALWAFINRTRMIARGGAIDMKHAIQIVTDQNKVMGWNKGYEPSAEDLAFVNRSEAISGARDYFNEVKSLSYQHKDFKEFYMEASKMFPEILTKRKLLN